MLQQPAPAIFYASNQIQAGIQFIGQIGIVIQIQTTGFQTVTTDTRAGMAQTLGNRINCILLVGDGVFDVQMFDVIVIFRQAIQRNHHILIEFESACMFGNGRHTTTIAPETTAIRSRYRHKSLAVAIGCNPANISAGFGDGALVIAGYVDQQYHAWGFATGGFGNVFNRLDVFFVEMF